ncbi:Fur family transcriptional regulator [Nonomuraea sp. SYSU D8015]|uniref:Fur family transcriptional regulator n=1 Tax=Nonomuraea sp. SYSU D8015 TaxID=2593644 RepID=UPI001CB6BE2F|nr:Fur family transcriptional regulator [Nonomuraea sp. SYSU D8015]
MTGAPTRWGRMLEEAGIRTTSQRLLVLDGLGRHRLPVSAQQIHAELHEQGERVGLTTVYRTLTSLAAAGLVHTFTQAGEIVYRLCGPAKHHHLICRSCGLVIERVEEEAMAGFRAEEVYGTCATCAGTS